MDNKILDKAILFAVEKHSGMKRKGKNLPFILHPMETVAIVGSITDDVELMAAAALHDVIENADVNDLDGFSHAILLYYFHKSKTCRMTAQPFLEDQPHGIFAIRSPHRPNHIGLSIVKITRIEPGRLYFQEVDMLDKTPVLDIKPYVKYFDSRENTTAGWVEKHFTNNTTPTRTILK